MESSTPPRDTAWAMSEENVEIVRQALERFGAGDGGTLRSLMSPTIESDVSCRGAL